MLGKPSFVSIRPYRDSIRHTTFGMMEALGFAMPPVIIIPAGTSDDDAVQALWPHVAVDALLIPFHSHTDSSGKDVNGIRLLARLRRDLGMRGPALMPVTPQGRAGFALARGTHDAQLISPLLEVSTDELLKLGADAMATLLAPKLKPHLR